MKKLSRSLFLWLAAAIVVTFIVVSGTGEQGFIAVYKAHHESQALTQEIAKSKHVIDSLTIELDRLKNDTAYIERIAREKLGMARRNEKIFKFIEKK